MATMMSTAVEKTAVVENPLRMPAVRADLLPVEVFQSRKNRRARRLVLIGVAVFMALVAVWYGTEIVRTGVRQDELEAVQQNVDNLKIQQKRYDDLIIIQKQASTIKDHLNTLMVNDVQQATLLARLRAAAPAGIELQGVTLTISGPGGQPEGALIGEAVVVGGVTITGTGPNKPTIATYVDALGKAEGLTAPFITSVGVDSDRRFGFVVQVDITAAALNSRFVEKKTEQAGD